MTILDRHILRQFFRLLLLTMLSFTLLYLIVDFFGRIRMFLSNDATVEQIASYFLYSMPQTVSLTVPVAMLLATLLSFSLLSKNNEIVAMKSSGVSIYRISCPLLIAAVLIAVCSFFFNEFITPAANAKAEYIKLVEVQKQQKGVFKRDQIWCRTGNAIYNFAYFNPSTNTLSGISVNYFDNTFHLTARIDARSARWTPKGWELRDLLVTSFHPGDFPVIEKMPSKIVDLPESPSELMAVQKEPDEMGFLELKEYVDKLKAQGFDPGQFVADMHGKIAFVAVNIILALIGVAFSLRSERSGGVALSIGAGIVIGFSYWIVFAFCLSLGRAMTIPPILAAWLANIILGIAAVVMYLRVRT